MFDYTHHLMLSSASECYSWLVIIILGKCVFAAVFLTHGYQRCLGISAPSKITDGAIIGNHLS